MEIMGKHSNIILIDKNESKIIESIKHVGFSQNSYRTILPGSTYIAPPKTDAKNPFDIPDEKLFEILQTEDLSARNLQKLSKVWGVTRPMNYQPYLRLINSRISVPSSIVK